MNIRKRKQELRATIKYCKEKYGVKNIHDIWDDFYYWCAREAWEILHNNKNYEDAYKERKNNGHG